ncbi:hypothetical protein M8C21_000911 [Ambrosia artemisiifolia]|uniref:Methyltransferase n=1 Tax=Ambrosia artemisiifolia TaxID=4212 RepID=A0AAD5G4U3_AMBAR|nr:hypothetical protein M8C21_000911 [Ambrosia artemisiifolia]
MAGYAPPVQSPNAQQCALLEMRKMKLSISRGIPRFVSILGVLSLLGIIYFKFYSLKPFLISDIKCKNFVCLAANKTSKAKMGRTYLSQTHYQTRLLIFESLLLDLKPGGIRIGLDFCVGTGTFAARMREHNVAIVSATSWGPF